MLKNEGTGLACALRSRKFAIALGELGGDLLVSLLLGSGRTDARFGLRLAARANAAVANGDVVAAGRDSVVTRWTQVLIQHLNFSVDT